MPVQDSYTEYGEQRENKITLKSMRFETNRIEAVFNVYYTSPSPIAPNLFGKNFEAYHNVSPTLLPFADIFQFLLDDLLAKIRDNPGSGQAVLQDFQLVVPFVP